MERRNRKPLRLIGWDYNSEGYYYVTICTYRKQILLGTIQRFVGARHDSPPANPSHMTPPPANPSHGGLPHLCLSQFGIVVDQVIQSIPEHFPNISVDQYIIMPNHIHLILAIKGKRDAGASHASPLQNQSAYAKVVGYLKAVSTKQIHRRYHCDLTIWQRGSYDHIIRTCQDYLRIRQYIHDNPSRWLEDEYYKG